VSPSRERLLVYGAYGYTARLILPKLKALGIDVVVAGRDAAKTEEVGSEFGMPSRVFSLDDPEAVDEALTDVTVALNAAGPYQHTTGPMVDGCLRNGVHYLDLSGEVGPLCHAARSGGAARDHGVMILPAIGFDVVPSDCLAAHVARQVPGATHLTFHVAGSNLISRGSSITLAEHIGIPVHTRRNGRLEQMHLRMQLRWVDFGSGHRPAVAVSWGDLVTAYHSTGIPNIEVYFEATAFRFAAVTMNQYWGWLLRSSGANAWLRQWADMLPAGPSEDERAQERCTIVVEAASDRHSARSRIETPEAYQFTAIAAVGVIEQVMAGRRTPGFQTPSTLFGPDFVMEFDGVTRIDL
jgi:short subunit dehydrogenase-like uncharacterized protein